MDGRMGNYGRLLQCGCIEGQGEVGGHIDLPRGNGLEMARDRRLPKLGRGNLTARLSLKNSQRLWLGKED